MAPSVVKDLGLGDGTCSGAHLPPPCGSNPGAEAPPRNAASRRAAPQLQARRAGCSASPARRTAALHDAALSDHAD